MKYKSLLKYGDFLSVCLIVENAETDSGFIRILG